MPTSTANFQAGRTVTGLSVVPLDENGRIRVYSSVGAHFQVDVLGFFSRDVSGGGFRTMTPTRVHDTRFPVGSPPPAAGQALTADTGLADVPANAAAVFGNLTTTGGVSAGDVRIGATAAATGATYTNLSISRTNQVIAAAVASKVDNGTVSIRATSSAHSILDILGWFEPTDTPEAGSITAAPFDPQHVPLWGSAPIISTNGRYVVFGQTSDLGVNTLQWWDRTTGVIEPVDAGHDPLLLANTAEAVKVTADGQRVLFSTNSPDLVPDDSDVDSDHFIYDRATGTIEQTALLPDGTPLRSDYMWFDSEITRMAFVSYATLDPGDTDIQPDTYEIDLATGNLPGCPLPLWDSTPTSTTSVRTCPAVSSAPDSSGVGASAHSPWLNRPPRTSSARMVATSSRPPTCTGAPPCCSTPTPVPPRRSACARGRAESPCRATSTGRRVLLSSATGATPPSTTTTSASSPPAATC